MDRNDKLYIAGHTGLVGRALLEKLHLEGYSNIITKTRHQLDLTRQIEVEDFFKKEKPLYVILAAARVGGIKANMDYPAEFLYENLAIQTNVIHSAYLHGTKKLLFFGSACSYPRDCPQPMKEEYLLTGCLEPTNEPYAVAKVAGIKMCQSYNRQYGADFICVVPTNTYGINDNFDPVNSHVIPAIITKFHEAKEGRRQSVVLWGTGSPVREFIYVSDLVDASVFLMQNYHGIEPVNVGSNEIVSINDLANIVKNVVGYQGEIVFDTSKPDGSARKVLDTGKLKNLGWKASTPLREGVRKTYEWYLHYLENMRN